MKHVVFDPNWFVEWFDSSYYHLLYSHRNENEGKRFLQALLDHLSLDRDVSLLDLCCGRGRHARYLASRGYQVIGLDLSPASIAYAQEHTQDGLTFRVADMRTFKLEKPVGAVFNLFTSFGYFEHLNENSQSLAQIHRALDDGGVFVLDYFNLTHVRNQRVAKEIVSKEGLRFELERYEAEGFVVKDVAFEADGKQHQFREFVQAIDAGELKTIVKEAGFAIENVFGDYDLRTFDEQSSPRTIIIARKR